MTKTRSPAAPLDAIIIGSGFGGIGMAIQLDRAGISNFLLLEKAAECIPAERLWVNPDCGLKTRGWAEVEPALANMVEAARELRKRYA